MMGSVGRSSTDGSRKSSTGRHNFYGGKPESLRNNSRRVGKAAVAPPPPPPSGKNPVRSAWSAIGACFFAPERNSETNQIAQRTPHLETSSSYAGSERRRFGRAKLQSSSVSQVGGLGFSMAEIRAATRNFSSSCKIGQGGFGTVYKGTLADGTVVAIKRAKKTAYDMNLGMEFKSEIQILASIEHLNLVRFHGCLEDDDEKLVILEYVSNGTLREHLDGLRPAPPLDLAARLDIAIDVAHAVTYLHMYADDPIIHRDIKSSNILLTDGLRAKVADFGFARVAPADADVTHVSTQVKGTAGYLDPEYLRTFQLTEKSDVYSFGALLVELLSGRRPIEVKREINERVTAIWALKKARQGRAMEALDPNLTATAATEFVVEKVLELAETCLSPTRRDRPTMRRCAEVLWAIRKDYRIIAAAEAPPPDTTTRSASSRVRRT